MPFGQSLGPPASPRQVQELLSLLKEAGHTSFRDARGPMRFTQRQAAGKFTRDEVSAFLEQLQGAEADGTAPIHPPTRLSPQELIVQDLPAELLARELRRRGWTLTEP